MSDYNSWRDFLYQKLEKVCPKKTLSVIDGVGKWFYHREDKFRIIKNNKNGNDKIFLIKGIPYESGMMSEYMTHVIPDCYAAEKMGYKCFVDLERFSWQYSVDRVVNGTRNSWEYYFKQPFGTTYEDCLNAQEIIEDGWRNLSTKKARQWQKVFDSYCLEFNRLPFYEQGKYMRKYGKLNEYVQKYVDNKYDQIFKGKTILGVFARGTDYLGIKPHLHAINPTVDELKPVIDDYLEKYDIDKIYCVTEDRKIFNGLKHLYKDKVFCIDDNFVDYEEDSHEHISSIFRDDPYLRGLSYISRIHLLSMCDYFVGGLAGGSSYALKLANYKEKYVFDLGKYK